MWMFLLDGYFFYYYFLWEFVIDHSWRAQQHEVKRKVNPKKLNKKKQNCIIVVVIAHIFNGV